MPPGPPAKGQQQLKVVLRRLPPNIPEDVLWQSVEGSLSSPNCVDWRQFVPGKLGSSKHKENVPSTAYLHFTNLEGLVAFSKAYQGHLFKDSKGNVSEALVEFAPFQRIPRSCKPDNKQGTIHDDPEFKAFMENPNAAIDAVEVGGAQVVKPGPTPLIEFLKNKHDQKAAAKSNKRANKHNVPDAPSGPSQKPSSKKGVKGDKSAAVPGVQHVILSKDKASSEAKKGGAPAASEGPPPNAKAKERNKKKKGEQQGKGEVKQGEPKDKQTQPLSSEGRSRSASRNPAKRSQQQQKGPPQKGAPPKDKTSVPGLASSKDGSASVEKASGRNNDAPAKSSDGPAPPQQQRRNRLNPNNRLLNAALGNGSPGGRKAGGAGRGGGSTSTTANSSSAPSAAPP